MIGQPALALELSQRDAAIAVRNSAGAVMTRHLGSGRDVAEGVLAVADTLLRECDLRPRELRLVAVSVGPGGFTGVRIAVAGAQAIAEASGAQAVGVPSALVAAETTLTDGSIGTALSLLAVKRHPDGADAWATTLRRDADGAWSAEDGALRSIVGAIESAAVAGVEVLLADPAHCPPPRPSAPLRLVEPRFDAAACLRLADRALARGAGDDPSRLAAIYPRRPEAVAIWDRRERDRTELPPAPSEKP